MQDQMDTKSFRIINHVNYALASRRTGCEEQRRVSWLRRSKIVLSDRSPIPEDGQQAQRRTVTSS